MWRHISQTFSLVVVAAFGAVDDAAVIVATVDFAAVVGHAFACAFVFCCFQFACRADLAAQVEITVPATPTPHRRTHTRHTRPYETR